VLEDVAVDGEDSGVMISPSDTNFGEWKHWPGGDQMSNPIL